MQALRGSNVSRATAHTSSSSLFLSDTLVSHLSQPVPDDAICKRCVVRMFPEQRHTRALRLCSCPIRWCRTCPSLSQIMLSASAAWFECFPSNGKHELFVFVPVRYVGVAAVPACPR